jgi:hypothetical protein
LVRLGTRPADEPAPSWETDIRDWRRWPLAESA